MANKCYTKRNQFVYIKIYKPPFLSLGVRANSLIGSALATALGSSYVALRLNSLQSSSLCTYVQLAPLIFWRQQYLSA